MDRRTLTLEGWLLVDWLTDDIEHATLRLFAHRDADRCASADDILTAANTIGTRESDRTHSVLVEVLGDLERDCFLAMLQVERVIDRRQLDATRELDIHDHTYHLGDVTGACFFLCLNHYILLLSHSALRHRR